MHGFHKDKQRYFNMQREVSQNYVIPFLSSIGVKKEAMHVLEIGCAEAGVLKAFLEEGHTGVGIELSPGRVKLAEAFLEKEITSNQVSIVQRNIYDIDTEKDLERKFDLIILKDVIEHIPDQERFIPELEKFLNPGGYVFFGFPPWYMPFGGHQQLCSNRWLSKLPWFHLLPMGIYKRILKWGNESQKKIEGLEEIKETGISIERLMRLVKGAGFNITGKKYWFTNPIYKYKFGFKPRKVPGILSQLPYIRNFYTTALHLVIQKK